MNKEIEELLSIISEGQNSIQLQEIEKYITNLQEENQKLKKIIDELEKFCNEEIKEWYKANFEEEIIDNSFRQTLTTYEFILKKLTELKNEVE